MRHQGCRFQWTTLAILAENFAENLPFPALQSSLEQNELMVSSNLLGRPSHLPLYFPIEEGQGLTKSLIRSDETFFDIGPGMVISLIVSFPTTDSMTKLFIVTFLLQSSIPKSIEWQPASTGHQDCQILDICAFILGCLET